MQVLRTKEEKKNFFDGNEIMQILKLAGSTNHENPTRGDQGRQAAADFS